MWGVIAIVILIIAILELLVWTVIRVGTLSEEKLKYNRSINRLRKEIEEVYAENNELRNLKTQEVHNNLVLIDKNRKLQAFKYEVENIINGERTLEDKLIKIKELLSENR